MALLLGIDTGGTYTDAVIYDDASGTVRHAAKALTTHGRLALGIGAAIDAVMAGSGAAPGAVALVSLSTTLATNALVEGQGGRAALVFIGFDAGDAQRGGLAEAMAGDPLIRIAGGHGPGGEMLASLDLAALETALAEVEADAFAVVARFASRSTAHEEAARDLIRARTGLPVTCGHELSARLNGPKRALTCLLNARLIGLIDGMIAATEAGLAARGIAAPLMLVRGDGALVSADFARTRPIETILSGPAASLVGAGALTGLRDAVVADIGGTTTDIAILRDGRPRISPEGAMVGGFQTMVEAVDMTAIGLGGDSEVTVGQGLDAVLTLGPRRVVPLALLACEHRALVLETLARQAAATLPGEHDGRFALPRADAAGRSAGLGGAALALLHRLGEAPAPLDRVLRARSDGAALQRLVARGLVRLAGFTPSDAAHVLGLHTDWDLGAAMAGAALMSRRRDGRGQRIAPDGTALARMVVAALTRASADAVLDATLRADGIAARAAGDAVIRAGLDGPRGATRIEIGLALPLIGLGASAPTYYPAVAERLGTQAVIPAHAGVANAVGAVSGRISVTREVLVTAPETGGFRVHDATTPDAFATLCAATDAAVALARAAATAGAHAAGASDPDTGHRFEESSARVEGRAVFLEGRAIATATGRPRLARDGV